MVNHFIASVVVFITTLYFTLSNSTLALENLPNFTNQLNIILNNDNLIKELSLFFAGCILVCIYFSIFACLIDKGLQRIFAKRVKPILSFTLAWVLVISFTLGLSYHFYPNLTLSSPAWGNQTIFFSVIVTLTFALCCSLMCKKNLTILMLMIIPIIFFEIPFTAKIETELVTHKQKENVIIIGIDSFNINELSSATTPFIHQFVSTGNHYRNSYTHIARTFPAWYSILAGKYPIHTNARLNLTDFSKLDRKSTLPAYLKSKGYRTIYIQDERRFNNIDEDFYFDTVIGPPATAGEFILATFANIPQLSLAARLEFFKFFMPHVINNRGAWMTYDPNNFVDYIARYLSTQSLKQGVFIGAHFTLPHWPYNSKDIKYNSMSSYEKYTHVLKSVDGQIASFYSLLDKKGLLKNSIVFLISDHGESFGRIEDIPSFPFRFPVNLAGHGTNIASKTQINTLFSYKKFGSKIMDPCQKHDKNEMVNVTTSDIFPTILYCLGLESDISRIGLDGSPAPKVTRDRIIPIESALQPLFNSTGDVDLEGTVKQYSPLYTINKKGQVIVKNELYEKVIASKQKGIIINEWSLLFYPELENTAFIVNFSNNSGEKYENFPNMEIKNKLYYEFCRYYETDIAIHSSGFCGNLSLADTKSMIYE